MKKKLKLFAPFALTLLVLALPVTAQQDDTREAGVEGATGTLEELRQLHSELGELIERLEGDISQRQRLEDRSERARAALG